jgi:hypothetical protein
LGFDQYIGSLDFNTSIQQRASIKYGDLSIVKIWD